MNMQQASPVSSALANMMQMQKLRQQTAQANVAPQLAQGQANIATGVGQQELGQGAYANPMAQAQLQNQLLVNKYYGPQTEATIQNIQSQAGLNSQQAAQVLQLTKQMPYELALGIVKLQAEHPFKAAGIGLTGANTTNLARTLTSGSLPGLNASNLAAGIKATTPNFVSSGTDSTGGAKVNPDGSRTTSTGRKFVRDPSVPGGWRLA